jgi:VanZ family protein
MDLLFQARTRLMFAILWGIGWLVVAALLLMPLPGGVPDGTDKVVHFLLFAGLAFGAIGFSHRVGQLAGLALVTIAGGTALEFAQRLVDYRTFELADATANALGASLGYALAVVVLLLLIRPTDPARI